jgi:hypothetical protein
LVPGGRAVARVVEVDANSKDASTVVDLFNVFGGGFGDNEKNDCDENLGPIQQTLKILLRPF